LPIKPNTLQEIVTEKSPNNKEARKEEEDEKEANL
jgi:hypothetical protein